MTIKYIMYPSIMYPELKVCRVHIHFALAVVLLSRIIYLVYKKKKKKKKLVNSGLKRNSHDAFFMSLFQEHEIILLSSYSCTGKN